MANDLRTEPEPSIASLVSGIISDGQELIKQQFGLLRTELQQELKQARNAAVSMGIGAGLAAIGGILLIVMLVHVLEHYTDIPLWGCYGIVGGAIALVAGILLYLGKKEADDVHLIAPPQSAAALRENMQWIQGETTPERT